MNKLFKIKFAQARNSKGRLIRLWGLKGNKGPQSWDETVELIVKNGVGKVEYVQHHDKIPPNYNKLDVKEMLRLWKSFELATKQSPKHEK